MTKIPLDKLSAALLGKDYQKQKKALRYILENYGLEGAATVKKAYDLAAEGSEIKALLKKAIAYLLSLRREKSTGPEKAVTGLSPRKDSQELPDNVVTSNEPEPADSGQTANGHDGAESDIPPEITEEWLVKQLFNEDKDIRYTAIKAAAGSNNSDLARPLENHLESESEAALKVAIIRVLVILRQEKALPVLLKCLVSRDNVERSAAAEMVADFSDDKVIRACNRLSGSSDMVSRKAAIYAAGVFETAESLNIVTRGLSDVKEEVREQSRKSLMTMFESGNMEAKETLVDMGLLSGDNAQTAVDESISEEFEEKLARITRVAEKENKGFLARVTGDGDNNLDKTLKLIDDRAGLLRTIGREIFSAYIGNLTNITYSTLKPLVKEARKTFDTIKSVKQELEKITARGLLGKLAGKSSTALQLESRLRHLGDELDKFYEEIGRVQVKRRDGGEVFSDMFEKQYLKIKDIEKKLMSLLPLIQIK